MLDGLTKLLFGYDIFVSYPYRDGRVYAEALTEQLENLDFSCFLDKTELPYGDQLSASLRRGIRRSKALLLVGTTGILKSSYVDLEVRLALKKRGSVIVPVDVDQIRKQVKWPEVQRLPWINEPEPTDRPSASVLEKIRGHFRFTRRNSIARRWVGIFATVFLAIAAVAIWQWRNAVDQRRVAIASGLAGQAELIRSQLDQGLQKSTLLGIESIRRYLGIGQVPVEAQQVLRKSVSLLPRHVLTLRHDSRVRDVSFSKDGKLLTTAGDDGTARVWSLDQGKELWRVDPDTKLGFVAVDAEGSHLATIAIRRNRRSVRFGGGSEIVHLWTHGQTEPATLAHEDPVTAAVFDGQLLATATYKSDCINFWSIERAKRVGSFCESGQRLQIAPSAGESGILISGQEAFRNHKIFGSQELSYVQQFHWSFSGREELIDSPGDAETLYSTSGWQAEVNRTALIPREKIARYAISPRGWFLAVIEREAKGTLQDTINIWALPKQVKISSAVLPTRAKAIVHESEVTDLEFSPGDRFLATSSRDDTARIWKADTGHEVVRIGHGNDVNAVTYSPDGRLLATASSDGTARVWDLTNSETSHIPNTYPVRAVAWDRSGRSLAMLTARDIRVWDREQGSLLLQDRVFTTRSSRGILGRDPRAPVFSPDDSQVIVAGRKSARRWSLSDGKVNAEVEYKGLDARVEFATVSPKGRLVTAVAGSIVGLWSLDSSERIALLPHEGKVWSVALHPDGSRLASVAGDGQIQLWHTDTGNRDTNFSSNFAARSLAFSPDGAVFAAGGKDSRVCLWSTDDWVEQNCIATNSRPAVVEVDFSPSGRYLVWGKGPARLGFFEVGIWDLDAGREVIRLEDAKVRVLAFSAKESYMAISDDLTYLPRVLENWQSDEKQPVLRINHRRAWAFAFTPDESLLASGAGPDNTARITVISLERLIDVACSRLARNLTAAEWRKYIFGERYQRTCENLPGEQ